MVGSVKRSGISLTTRLHILPFTLFTATSLPTQCRTKAFADRVSYSYRSNHRKSKSKSRLSRKTHALQEVLLTDAPPYAPHVPIETPPVSTAPHPRLTLRNDTLSPTASLPHQMHLKFFSSQHCLDRLWRHADHAMHPLPLPGKHLLALPQPWHHRFEGPTSEEAST